MIAFVVISRKVCIGIIVFINSEYTIKESTNINHAVPNCLLVNRYYRNTNPVTIMPII